MERRKALKLSAGLIGGAIAIGSSALMYGCKTDASDGWMPTFLDKDQLNLIAELAETIIPKTDTPGAKDALVHRFIDGQLAEHMTEKVQTMFTEGLMGIEELAKSIGGKGFVDLDQSMREKVMDALVEDAEEHKAANKEGPASFDALVDMVKNAFFNSEVAAKQVLNYDPSPGKYIGCYPLKEVGSAWAL